ncbi:MAG: pyridoxamine 5'-phosphate oxidase family protein [Acidobacteria bacterium]|jgi:predicted pyridoxine 5'-phosphate oxidase superfamily flavin-nucleotide-binding protein|nr:pyridoxamine 5'-phosphate oxidase family protein [Acidobacteriota bacterium]
MSRLLAAARASLDGALPATISTVDAAGVPNVSYISRVMYVDEEHVALSNQFFRKTRANLESNPHAMVMVVDPRDCRQFLLTLELEGSHTEGPVFDQLKAEVDSIATMTGMGDVFRLVSADVFRVRACVALPVEEEASADEP